jgi:hypothetical protein
MCRHREEASMGSVSTGKRAKWSGLGLAGLVAATLIQLLGSALAAAPDSDAAIASAIDTITTCRHVISRRAKAISSSAPAASPTSSCGRCTTAAC